MPHEPYLSYSADPAVAVGHATHAGQSGKNNEDLYALFQTRYEGDDGFGARHALVLAVADGIGGSVAGELASDLAIQAVAAAFRESRRPIPQRLDAAIRRANADIYHQSSENAALAGMGTTIVAAIVGADQVQIGHVGDSRAYLLRNGALYLLTQDHSWAQEAVDAGRLTPEAARVHPNRHVIKRYLGGAPEVEIDYRLLPPPQSAPQGAPKAAPAPAHIAASLGNGQTATQPMAPRTPTRSLSNESLDFLPGDTLLLCSDGLSDVVAHDAIRDILKRHDPQSAADKLVAEANRAGGPDNITVIVARRAGGALPMAARRRPPVWVGALLLALLAGAGGGTAFLLAGRNDAAGDGAQAALAMAATATDAPAAGLVTETPTETPAEPTQTPTPTPLPEATTDASALAPPVAPPVEPMTASAAVSGTDGVTDSTALQAEPTATDTPAPIPPTPTLPPNTTATPTPRAKSTLAVTKTPTPSATPSPTPTPSATPPSTNTPTVTPTSPPSTPTNTPAAPALLWTLTPSVTPTGAPQGAAPGSPAAAPTLAPAPSGGPTAINANRPPPGETYDAGVSVSFEYKLVGELAAGQSLRLVIWQAGETPGSRWYPASPSTATAPPLNQGTYWWGVQVVDEGSATVVRLLPSDRTFVVQPPARDEGGNDEDDDGGDDDEDDDGGDPGGGPPPP